jgi:hypothetical protein
MKSPSEVERIQEAIRRMDAFPGPAVLFDREEQIIHANKKARSLFTEPLLTRHDLPEALTVGLDDALAKGRWSAFRFQVTGGPLLRNRIEPEHFDLTQPETPTCAISWMREEPGGGISESIAMNLMYELRGGAVPLDTHLKLFEAHQSDPEFMANLKRAGDYIIKSVTRVCDVLLSVAVVSPDAREPVSLASLTAEAYQKLKLYRGEKAPLQLVCKGPDDLTFSTGNLGRLRTLFTEILLDVDHPSNSVTVQWAEDHERLGVPTAKIEFATGGFNGAGFGLCVAEELTLDMHGCMAFTVGTPGTLNLWLPLTPP